MNGEGGSCLICNLPIIINCVACQGGGVSSKMRPLRNFVGSVTFGHREGKTRHYNEEYMDIQSEQKCIKGMHSEDTSRSLKCTHSTHFVVESPGRWEVVRLTLRCTHHHNRELHLVCQVYQKGTDHITLWLLGQCVHTKGTIIKEYYTPVKVCTFGRSGLSMACHILFLLILSLSYKFFKVPSAP